MAVTILEYMFRDTQNFKSHAEAVFNHEITAAMIDDVAAACLGGPGQELFIPAQIGLHNPYDTMPGYYDDDPYYCEILRWTTYQAIEPLPGLETIETFVARFTAVSWDIPAAEAALRQRATNR